MTALMTTDDIALAVVTKEQALVAFTDADAFDKLYRKVEEQVSDHKPDLTTPHGRKEIAALAFRVVKTKTALVAMADELTADARKTVSAVVSARQKMEQQLNDLRDKTREPLTKWELAEKAREETVNAGISELRKWAVVLADWTSDQIQGEINALTEFEIDQRVFGDHYTIAINLRDSAFAALEAGKARALVAEENARELDRLRTEAAERQRIQDEADAKAEAAAAEKEVAAAEEKRIADEQAKVEADRQARDLEIAEAARQEVERKALDAAETERATHRAALEEQERQRKAAEDEAAKLRRKEDLRLATEAEAQRHADARAKDRAHKTAVMTVTKLAIIGVAENGNSDLEPGRIENIAIQIVRAIVAGEIPSVTLAF